MVKRCFYLCIMQIARGTNCSGNSSESILLFFAIGILLFCVNCLGKGIVMVQNCGLVIKKM